MRLEFPTTSGGRLFGRDDELQRLWGMQQATIGGRTRACLVHGPSGSGKTTLCEQLKKKKKQQPAAATATTTNITHRNNTNGDGAAMANLTTESSPIFVSGKFGQFQDHKPDSSALLQALEQLGSMILKRDQEKHFGVDLLDVVRDCLNDEAKILIKVVPSFATAITLQEEAASSGSKSSNLRRQSATDISSASQATTEQLSFASERLAVAIQVFLRKFCNSNGIPLIMFLDDIQWSDPGTLDILSAVLRDDRIKNLFLVGGYRDEEASKVQPFVSTLKRDEHVHVDDIQLSDLDVYSVNDLVSSFLSSDIERTMELSQIILAKTRGNPLFVINFVKTLHSEGLISYHFGKTRWEWDLQRIETETDISDNVVDVVTNRIQKLHPSVGKVLKLAACIGYSCDMTLLESLYEHTELSTLLGDTDYDDNKATDYTTAIETAEAEGLLERRMSADVKFTHDRVQQSVYELLPTSRDRDHLHYKIGQHIQKNYDLNADQTFLFLATEQLDLGAAAITSDEDRKSLIELNYRAAIGAKAKVGIDSVLRYLNNAIKLLVEKDWEDSYDLLVEVYSMSTEVEFAHGRIDLSQKRVAVIVERAKSSEDTVRARIVQMEIHGAQRMFVEAIREARTILKILGFPLPASTSVNVFLELWRTKKLVKNLSDEEIVAIEETSNTRHRYAMKVLAKSSVYGWSHETLYMKLTYIRLLRMSLLHGFCEDTPYGISSYGSICAIRGDYKNAYRFAKLSLKTDQNSSSVSCPLMVYSTLSHFAEPIALGMEPALKAYRTGLETGEIFYGSLCMAIYGYIYFYCGLPLKPLINDMVNYGGQLKLCHQDYGLAYVMSVYQISLNLTGGSTNPVDMSREAVRKHDIFSENLFLEPSDPSYLAHEYMQVFNAFVLNELDIAEEAFTRILRRTTRRLTGTHMYNYFLWFVDGIAGCALWRSSRNKIKFRDSAIQAQKYLRQCFKKRMFNCDGILFLIEAEVASIIRKKHSDLRPMYDKAISTFMRTGFVHFAAIANELASNQMSRQQDEFWEKHYITQATQLYAEWGATVKVDQLLQQHNFLQSSNITSEALRGSNLRGKSRFDAKVDSIKQSQ